MLQQHFSPARVWTEGISFRLCAYVSYKRNTHSSDNLPSNIISLCMAVTDFKQVSQQPSGFLRQPQMAHLLS